ncbi:MAG: GxxExxY protein [Syntrophomonadaceae bacterium]|nr:GxxExxY protein [Syntrophomonadaceae bacterium]
MDYLHKELTEKIISCAFEVHNYLGYGFAEKVYENAFRMELEQQGFQVIQQKALTVTYKDIVVGEYIADLIVNDLVIIEVKAIKNIDQAHEAQLMNYLKATGIKLGLIINFGTRVNIKRIFSENLCASVFICGKNSVKSVAKNPCQSVGS